MPGIAGLLRHTKVTICIPTWEAEGFIDRTLGCARNQTYANTRILVSVDQSGDATTEICKAHAREDARIEVFPQSTRLGWAGNVNFLLDRVSTEFYYIYFHDDLIEPTYTARLLKALHKRPDAASVHCDMGHFGGSDHVSVGRDYEGTAGQRLISFLFSAQKGSPLRSMTRATALDTGLRLPTEAEGGLWANQPFLMTLLAAGPALRVPEILYRRWDKRSGGLTDLWARYSLDQVISGFRTNARICFDILDSVGPTQIEKNLMTFGLYIYLMSQIRRAEYTFGAQTPLKPEALHPRFRDVLVPDALSQFTPQVREWAIGSYERIGNPA